MISKVTEIKESLGDQYIALGKLQALTADELCAIMRVSRSTVSGWVRCGCPCYPVSDRPVHQKGVQLRFDLGEVKTWRKSFSYND